MGHIQNLEDLLIFVRRHFWLAFAISTIGIILSAIYAKTRPDTYEATASIGVQSAQVAGAESTASAQLFQLIEQRLTTRDNLQAVIDRHGLYKDLPALTSDERIALLRQNLTIVPIAAAGSNPYAGQAQISAILISARDGDPDIAPRIANDFAQGVLDMSLNTQIEKARDTVAFFLDEEARLSKQIRTLEAAIAEYKNENSMAVPGVADLLREEAVSLETDVRALDQSLVALQGEERRLEAIGDLRETDRRRLKELRSEIAVLSEQKGSLSLRMAEVEAKIARIPEVDLVVAGYQRELDLLEASLEVVATKLAGAQSEAKLAERQQTERFALLDRAKRPDYPSGSGGKKLFLAGIFASILFAAGIAFVLDLLKPVLRTSAQMERQLGIRPIVAIPTLSLPRAARRN